mmetsp:Transcript_38185/g.114178  ORF Transcript_38185/g.114178 Transcript_38185/m.114178 type:complete len:251 (+) Transcript_38185:540-1292(+)
MKDLGSGSSSVLPLRRTGAGGCSTSTPPWRLYLEATAEMTFHLMTTYPRRFREAGSALLTWSLGSNPFPHCLCGPERERRQHSSLRARRRRRPMRTGNARCRRRANKAAGSGRSRGGQCWSGYPWDDSCPRPSGGRRLLKAAPTIRNMCPECHRSSTRLYSPGLPRPWLLRQLQRVRFPPSTGTKAGRSDGSASYRCSSSGTVWRRYPSQTRVRSTRPVAITPLFKPQLPKLQALKLEALLSPPQLIHPA